MAWPEFGKVLRRYSGTGTITIDAAQASCDFSCAQRSDGWILLRCRLRRLSADLASLLGGAVFDKKLRLSGKTPTGEEFQTGEGPVVKTSVRGRGATLEASVPHAEIGGPPSRGTATLRFGLANLDFIGNEVVRTRSGAGLTRLAIRLPDASLAIDEKDDYRAVVARIRAERGTDITSELTVKCSARDVDRTTALVDTVCRLLSLARGSLISWFYRDVVANRRVVHSRLRHSVVGSYSGMHAINPWDTTSTNGFVEQAYAEFTRLESAYSLREVVHAYCSARGEGFLELKGLQAATLLDFLCGRLAAEKGRTYILDEGAFKAATPDIRRKLKQVLYEAIPSARRGDLSEAAGNVPALNRRSFRRLLSELAQQFSVPLTTDDMGQVVKTRNSLVHAAKYSTQETWQEYRLLMNTLDKVLLRMVAYEGPYIDVLHGFGVVPLQASLGKRSYRWP